MSRVYIEQIVERARDIRRLEADRLTTRAALLDITIDVAQSLAQKTDTLLEQAMWNDTKKKLQIRRNLRAQWRLIVKGVKTLYDDHPISDRHLCIVLATCYPRVLKDNEALFGHTLTGDEHFQIQRCFGAPSVRRKLAQQLLSRIG
jgi:hypothetical protein